MIYELQANEFERVRPLFGGLKNRVAIHAIIEGNALGRVFVDDPGKPTAAFMWNEFRYSYLAGGADDYEFIGSLRQLLAETLLPQARDSHDPTLVLYPYPATWHERIGDLIGDQAPIELARRTFTFVPNQFRYQDWEKRVPSGLHMQPIDEALLATGGQEVTAGIQVLWRSSREFLDKGAGFCLLHGDQVVSTCFSAFVGSGKREIGVDTHPQHQRRGFATLTAAAFITDCLQTGWEPVWECWADNTSSNKLAEKLGFVRASDYPVYFVDLVTIRER